MKPANERIGAVAIATIFAIQFLWTTAGEAQVKLSIAPPVVSVGPIAPPSPTAPIFNVRSYLGKCLDFGFSQTSGVQVFLYDCNNSPEQQVRVQEVNARHDVILCAGNKVLGYRPPPPVATLGGSAEGSAPVSPVYALELQDPASTSKTGIVALGAVTPANQIFALDGDSIILAANRALVVQVQNARPVNGTPLIVAARRLADSELWDFNQFAGGDIDPTPGFVRAGYPGDRATAYDTLLSRLLPDGGRFCQNAGPACQPSPAVPGTVIKIYPDADINLTGLPPLMIPTGVTIRGNRRGVRFGPLVHMDTASSGENLFEITGDDVRITGLRLQGTSRSTDTDQPNTRAVMTSSQFLRTIVDRNDISSWTTAGVEVRGMDPQKVTVCDAGQSSDPLNRPYDVLITHNFIHHNEMQNLGYGVVASKGAYPLVTGNTFYLNRHAIASDGSAHSGYHAWFNLVLEDGPEQTWHGIPYHTQDFDMHGTGDGGFGGIAGDYVQMLQNTFLGTNRPNYEIRGIPCNQNDFYYNVSLASADDAISVKLSDNGGAVAVPAGTLFVAYDASQFSHSNPVYRPAVGDFDGDGVQDLFFGTGAAWYYSAQGTAEWRLLNPKIEKMSDLIFGDFDGDGRTEVAGMNGNKLMVSWGGTSEWEYLNTVNAPITDLAVGKFANHAPGDRRDDIFWADGKQWYLSAGGTGPFNFVNTSSFRVKDLRFGDFDGNGATDVLGVVSGKWMVSYNAATAWTPLPKSLTGSMNGVVVADFDGDGRADIATSTPFSTQLGLYFFWKFSSAGASDWTYRTPASGAPLWSIPISSAAAIGYFDGNPGADVLIWGNDEHLYIVSGGSLQGSVASPMYSRQDMR